MNARQRALRKINVPNRSRGKRSPLDRLPPGTQRELVRRLGAGETYQATHVWLAAEHSLEIGLTALSDWWRKRQVEGPQSSAETFRAGGFEITVKAPGADSITVRVTPMQKQEGNG